MPVAMGTTKQLTALRTPASQTRMHIQSPVDLFRVTFSFSGKAFKQTRELQDVQNHRVGQLVEQTGSCSFWLDRSHVTGAADAVDQPAETTRTRGSSGVCSKSQARPVAANL